MAAFLSLRHQTAVRFDADDLVDAIRDQKVLIPPNSPGTGAPDVQAKLDQLVRDTGTMRCSIGGMTIWKADPQSSYPTWLYFMIRQNASAACPP